MKTIFKFGEKCIKTAQESMTYEATKTYRTVVKHLKCMLCTLKALHWQAAHEGIALAPGNLYADIPNRLSTAKAPAKNSLKTPISFVIDTPE